jgi:hypothetical protein
LTILKKIKTDFKKSLNLGQCYIVKILCVYHKIKQKKDTMNQFQSELVESDQEKLLNVVYC